MVAKAPNDIPKQVILAANMCKAIKDALKMERRYKAAIQILGDSSPVTNVFAQGCISMGITIGNIKSEQEDDTIEASAADDVKINIPERSEEAIVDTPVKPVINYNYKKLLYEIRNFILGWNSGNGVIYSDNGAVIKNNKIVINAMLGSDYSKHGVLIGDINSDICDSDAWKYEITGQYDSSLEAFLQKLSTELPLYLYKLKQSKPNTFIGLDIDFLTGYFDIDNEIVGNVLNGNNITHVYDDLSYNDNTKMQYKLDEIVYNICKALNISDMPTEENPGFKIAAVTEKGYILTPCIITTLNTRTDWVRRKNRYWGYGHEQKTVSTAKTGKNKTYPLPPAKINALFKKTVYAILGTKRANDVCWLGASVVYIPKEYIERYC